MSGNPEDPDFSSVPASLPGPISGSSATETTAAELRAAIARMAETNKGGAVESAKARTAEITAAARALATNLAIVETAAKELKEAQAAWEKAAEGAKKTDLDKADEEVQAAKKKNAQAAAIENSARDAVNAAQAAIDACEENSDAWYDAMRTWSAAKSALTAAEEVRKAAEAALAEARKKAQELKAKNKAANDDLRRAYRSIAAKLATIDRTVLGGGRGRWDGGTERGTGRPGTVNVPGYREPYSPGAGPGAGTARGSGSGAGAAKGGKEMPSMPSTPAKPTETRSTGSGKVDPQSLLTAAALMNGQQQQQQQPQAAAATPQQTAAQPQQTQQPQEKKDGEKKGKEALDSSDIDRLIKGEDVGRVLLGQEGVPQLISNYTPGPSSPNPHTTQFRPAGTPITGTTGGGTPLSSATAQQVTSGSSVTGMNTRADVSGSSTPAAGAYDPVKTNTSAAHGTATEQQQSQQQRTGAAPVGGVPHAMAPGAAGGGSGAAPRKAEDLPKSSGVADGGLDQGRTAVSEAVPGGTICQNRPDTTGKAA